MFSALLLASAWAQGAVFDFDRLSDAQFRRLLETAPPPSAPRAPAGQAVFERDGSLVSPEELSRRLSAAGIAYAGEQHDLAAHHGMQLSLMKSLRALKANVALGLEMVSQDLQAKLDDFLAGRLSDSDFEKFWKKAWGYDYALYRPILEYCRAQDIPVRGLNAPIAVVRQIAKGGLSSLTPEQRRWLPASVEQTSDPRYLAYLNKSLDGHGPMPPAQKARMLEAMAAWNETMGEAAALVARERPLLVLAGSGHLLYGKGVPESAARRGAARQEVVLPYPLDGEAKPLAELLKTLRDPASGDAELADHFWLLPAD